MLWLPLIEEKGRKEKFIKDVSELTHTKYSTRKTQLILQVDNGMSYNSETSLINYVSKYIGYTFYLKF